MRELSGDELSHVSGGQILFAGHVYNPTAADGVRLEAYLKTLDPSYYATFSAAGKGFGSPGRAMAMFILANGSQAWWDANNPYAHIDRQYTPASLPWASQPDVGYRDSNL
ncbi:hypothetical protein [Asaia astilbis]